MREFMSQSSLRDDYDDEPELQWFEDSVNYLACLIFCATAHLLWFGCSLIVAGVRAVCQKPAE